VVRDGDPWQPPDGVGRETIEAVGKLSEALEWIERARGVLYDFHHLVGHADFLLDEAAESLERAGHPDAAARIRDELIGRNVLEGRWTFQIVEDFDDNYWRAFRDQEHSIRDELVGGKRHLYEASLKEQRRTHGRRHHEGRPVMTS
jgi:hypothetical protein